jgi:hypothetical protein
MGSPSSIRFAAAFIISLLAHFYGKEAKGFEALPSM